MNINISFAAMVPFGFAQDRLNTHHERHSFPLTLSLSKGLQLRLRRIPFRAYILRCYLADEFGDAVNLLQIHKRFDCPFGFTLIKNPIRIMAELVGYFLIG